MPISFAEEIFWIVIAANWTNSKQVWNLLPRREICRFMKATMIKKKTSHCIPPHSAVNMESLRTFCKIAFTQRSQTNWPNISESREENEKQNFNFLEATRWDLKVILAFLLQKMEWELTLFSETLLPNLFWSARLKKANNLLKLDIVLDSLFFTGWVLPFGWLIKEWTLFSCYTHTLPFGCQLFEVAQMKNQHHEF